jgi:succinate-semialdehyde dehydrogenase/glutarate-semialdehyde dehydrogenase
MKLSDSGLLKQQALINGRWVDAADGRTITVTDPATGETIATVPKFGRTETEQAIVAAEQAQIGWRARTASDRAKLLRDWFDAINANVDDLAMIMTREQGKPLAEARGEIKYAASFVEWFAEEAKRVYGDVIPGPLTDKRIVVLRQPVGVCAAITPWNFPAAMITRKVAPALAAGCTIIIKPASQTPLTALALAELAQRVGIPAGVVQVVPGDARAIGAALAESQVVRKISFTGSTEIGRMLMAQCAPTVKRLSLELGGNAPFIVFDDANIDDAVAGAIVSKYRNNGQTCICANRIYVQEGIYDEFAQKLAAKVRELHVGHGIEDKVEVGPLIDSAAVEKVEELVQDAKAHGAKVLIGGERHARGGLFYAPTILTDLNTDMAIASEEIFGPIAPLFKFKDEADVIVQANNTEYGLASYFYTRDISRVWRVAEALEYGMVGINTGAISTEVAPFGGIKQSGFGREGSRYGIDEYIDMKYLCMQV